MPIKSNGYDSAKGGETEKSGVTAPDESIAKWISWLRNRHGMDKLVQACGKSAKQIRRYEAGAEPPFSVVSALAALEGKKAAWLISHDEQAEPEVKALQPDADTYALVPRLSVRAAAGAGAVNYQVDEIPDGALAFRHEWLRERGVDPRHAAIIEAWGDSMEPTIRDGDVLLVNTALDHVRTEGIYVIRFGEVLLVKRIAVGMDSVTLISDNPAIANETIPRDRLAELHIVGRVVWFGRAI